MTEVRILGQGLPNELPLIDRYEEFVKFNNTLLNSENYPIRIMGVGCSKGEIRVSFPNNKTSSYSIDEFIYEFVVSKYNENVEKLDTFNYKLHNAYIEEKDLKGLVYYDFMKLYSRTHPKEFKNRIIAYGNKALQNGEDTFGLFDFNVQLLESNTCSDAFFKILNFRGNYNSSHVVIPYGAYSIEKEVFYICKELDIISIPDTLKEIGEYAFEGAELESLDLPDSIEVIGSHAFKKCTIKHIKLPKNLRYLGEGAFEDSTIEEIEIPDTIEEIKEGTFNNCEKLHKVALSETLKHIGKGAFAHSGIEEISIPCDVEVLDGWAFEGCKKLESVTLPKTLKEIGESAFAYSGIKNIEIPNTLETIGDNAFFGCGIKYIELPKNLKYLGKGAFQASSLEKIELPNELERIEDNTFFYCAQLHKVVLPNNLKYIGENALSHTNISKIELPDSVEEIGRAAFSGDMLTSVKLSKNLLIIGAEAFSENRLLPIIEIPASVEIIGSWAFAECTNLTPIMEKIPVIPDIFVGDYGNLQVGICAFLHTQKDKRDKQREALNKVKNKFKSLIDRR